MSQWFCCSAQAGSLACSLDLWGTEPRGCFKVHMKVVSAGISEWPWTQHKSARLKSWHVHPPCHPFYNSDWQGLKGCVHWSQVPLSKLKFSPSLSPQSGIQTLQQNKYNSYIKSTIYFWSTYLLLYCVLAQLHHWPLTRGAQPVLCSGHLCIMSTSRAAGAECGMEPGSSPACHWVSSLKPWLKVRFFFSVFAAADAFLWWHVRNQMLSAQCWRVVKPAGLQPRVKWFVHEYIFSQLCRWLLDLGITAKHPSWC